MAVHSPNTGGSFRRVILLSLRTGAGSFLILRVGSQMVAVCANDNLRIGASDEMKVLLMAGLEDTRTLWFWLAFASLLMKGLPRLDSTGSAQWNWETNELRRMS